MGQTLSVIMPALNEENNIDAAIISTLEAFKKRNINGEVIVINDGSTDRTGELVEEIARHNSSVSVIHHDCPKGIGYSFWDGVKHSTKDVVVMFPGDNENDSDNALEFFHLMQDVDIIVPFIHNIEVRDRFRRLISSIYRFIINMSFGINLNYTNGTVFYRREILDGIELKNYGFFYQAEILIKLIRKGYLFAEIPNYLCRRNSGKSKAVTLKSLSKVINGYLQLVFDIHIKRIDLGKNPENLNINSVSYRKYIEFQENDSCIKEVSNV